MPPVPPFSGTTTSTITAAIFSLFTTAFSTTTTTTTKIPRLRKPTKIPTKYKAQAIQQAQEAITDYLHSTRSLPFLYAEHIVKNATLSLSSTISQIPFHPSTFLNSVQKFLRYNPINEFQFFYESIGIDYNEINARFTVNKLFLSEDSRGFSAACDLADFGFPWNKLAILCNEKVDVFSNEDGGLLIKLSEFKDRYGFSNALVVGICLAFPRLLSGFCESEELLSDLKRVLLDTELVNYVKRNVDGSYGVCRKIKLFYELGGKKGEVGELLAMNHQIFIDYAEDDLVRKIDFFCRLGVDREQVGLLLLLKPDILKFDLEDRVISVSSFLKHFSLSEEDLKHIKQNYPHVLGKNRMVNVPHIIRATNLSEWFFNTIKSGDHSLLATYRSSNQNEDADEVYRNNFQKALSRRSDVDTTDKLDFLHGIGFGENKFTVEAMRNLRGTNTQFYKRFKYLLSVGIRFSKLCKMISLSPNILNQSTYLLERKLNFLCKEMDYSLENLSKFPSYLMYDLDNRLKPRFRFHTWLKAQGWWRKEYSFSTMIALNEKKFIAHISDFHTDAPKKWLECQNEINEFQYSPSRCRHQAFQQGQEAIKDYLHNTRSLPLAYAEHIAKNSSVSLSFIISQVPFQQSTFLSSLQRFLRYHPINEFEFFYESIGIDYKEIKAHLPVNKFFLSEDSGVFSAACALVDFGFPWNKLGMLCTGKNDIFCNEVRDWRIEFSEFKDRYGFSNSVVVGICLAFPDVLSRLGESDELLSDLKKVLLNSDLVNHVEGNVDATVEVCRKVRLFYELGCKKGDFGELLVMNPNIFIDYAEDDLVRKIDFFCKLGVDKEQVGLLLLLKPDILKIDLEHPVISVLKLLQHFNLSEKNLKHIEQNYPYVLGKNRMRNVPHIIRATDLCEWFFNTIKHGDHSLLATYPSSNQGEDADDDYWNNLQKILSGKYHAHNTSKLDFLHGIGFGENKFTAKVMPKLKGTSFQLYERFNFLLSLGIKFSELCKMIRSAPEILNMNTYHIERKVKFLCKGVDSSLEYLCQYPSYLKYDLENRIMPRLRFHMWLKAQGWCKKEYCISSMLAPSEKAFEARISGIHPDASKKWVEFRKELRKQVAWKSRSELRKQVAWKSQST